MSHEGWCIGCQMADEAWGSCRNDEKGNVMVQIPVIEGFVGKCLEPPVGCGKDLDLDSEFREELHRREYMISGMCQDCQDRFFLNEEPDYDEEPVCEVCGTIMGFSCINADCEADK